ncbi:MAG: peptidylprolyl isomerase [Myxococcota bacterium]
MSARRWWKGGRRGRGLAAGLVVSLAPGGCRLASTGSEAPATEVASVHGEAGVDPDPAASGGDRSDSDRSGGDRSGGDRSGEPGWVSPGEVLLARVGEVSLSRAEFDAIYALKEKKYVDRGRTIPDSARRRYRRSIAMRLVVQERLRQYTTELGMQVDPAKIEARMEQQRRGIRDWPQHLERRGETDDSLRAMVVAELQERLILEHRGALEPTRTEIEQDYAKIKDNWRSNKTRVRASHILVPIVPGPGESESDAVARARAEAREVYAKVTAPGADFAALARELSVGPSADKGGDIGIFTRDRMAAEFSKVAFSQKPGRISKPVKTKFGFHIIKVVGRWPPGVLPLEALEEQLADRLRERAFHQGRRALKAELAERYPVVHYVLTPQEQEGEPDQPPVSETIEPPGRVSIRPRLG